MVVDTKAVAEARQELKERMERDHADFLRLAEG